MVRGIDRFRERFENYISAFFTCFLGKLIVK